MLNILSIIFLLLGLVGIIFLIIKKEKLLIEKNITYIDKHQFFKRIKVRNPLRVKEIQLSKILQRVIKRFLIKVKIFFIKGENKIDRWIQRVSQSKKFSENYWEKVKQVSAKKRVIRKKTRIKK